MSPLIEIQNKLKDCLHQIAPEFEISSLLPEKSIRSQVELDSVDFLRFILSVHHSFGVDIPETDYSKIQTLQAFSNYLQAELECKTRWQQEAELPPDLKPRTEP
jgi:acyl carrier protein